MSRTTIAILIITAVIGVYFVLVIPLDEKRAELKKELESKYITLTKNERFVLKTQMAGVELKEQLKELDEMEQFIIHASDTSLAFAELQSKVQDIADAAGITVLSIKPLSAISYKGYRGLPIYFDGTGDIKNLSEFLNFLDSTWEFISVEKLSVSSAPGDMLRIKIQLSGLMKT